MPNIQPLQISIFDILYCKPQCSLLPTVECGNIQRSSILFRMRTLQRVNDQYYVGAVLNIQYPNLPRDDLIWPPQSQLHTSTNKLLN